MKTTALVAGTILLMAISGCAGNRQQMVDTGGEYVAPASIYSVMDSTSLVYTDYAAGAALYDNPLRWVAIALHPVGQAIDYGVNRPIYTLGSRMPYLFGYTSEDSMLDNQRR
ncbi:MAG TPA: hypothetical protein VJ746_12320 [Nitrospira sp.]|nr:hypothetical protein [Nitrospira sp.]